MLLADQFTFTRFASESAVSPLQMGARGDAPATNKFESAQRIMVDTEGTGKMSQGDAAVDEKATGRRRGHTYGEWHLDSNHVHKKTINGMHKDDQKVWQHSSLKVCSNIPIFVSLRSC